MRENLVKDDVLNTIKMHHPEIDVEHLSLQDAYDLIFREITNLLYNTPYGVYIPAIGVLYKEELKRTTRLSDTDAEGRRFKFKLSAKPYWQRY